MEGIKEPEIRVSTNVEIAVRRWHPDPEGSEFASDGQRGFYGPWDVQKVHNLFTSAGRDFLHQQGYATSGLGTCGANYIALSSDTASPLTADTTLTGEITGAGGLARAQGTVTHVAGNTTTTVAKTFTALTTYSAVQKSGLFTLSSGGTMVHENTFTSVNLEANDQLACTWTATLQ